MNDGDHTLTSFHTRRTIAETLLLTKSISLVCTSAALFLNHGINFSYEPRRAPPALSQTINASNSTTAMVSGAAFVMRWTAVSFKWPQCPDPCLDRRAVTDASRYSAESPSSWTIEHPEWQAFRFFGKSSRLESE